jgi:hypothetical protein
MLLFGWQGGACVDEWTMAGDTICACHGRHTRASTGQASPPERSFSLPITRPATVTRNAACVGGDLGFG